MQGLITGRLASVVVPAAMILSFTMPVYADSHFGRSAENAAERYDDNPWAVPQSSENPLDFQRLPKYRSQQYRPESTDRYGRANRFVTPEILESIKRQQTQSQMMYGNPYYGRPYNPQPAPQPYGGYNYNSAPLPGGNYPVPLYDVPPVSPWGSSPDLLYRGQSFPLIPNEALGGLPPMPLYNGAPGVSDSFFDPFSFSQGMYGY